jgi:hypothetical protein
MVDGIIRHAYTQEYLRPSNGTLFIDIPNNFPALAGAECSIPLAPVQLELSWLPTTFAISP